MDFFQTILKLYEKHLTPGCYRVPRFIPTKKTTSIGNKKKIWKPLISLLFFVKKYRQKRVDTSKDG